jgi:nucleotidyltransferase substrate binding protein (TIGR01987 family)
MTQKLLTDFKKALEQLKSALEIPAEDNVRKAGCIQYFEFCFELAWKTIKKIAEDQGLKDANSPKSALKTAFKQGWIQNEEVWLGILSARNAMSHTYSQEHALDIYEELPNFTKNLDKLLDKLNTI